MAAYTKKYTFAPLPQTTRGESIKLAGDPKGKNFVYTNGKSVFVRDIENPTLSWEYVGHTAQTTVARYSPSGFYIASGDAHGNVRIWDTVNEEHILKNEVRPVSGRIRDIAWDSESKRLIAVGDGKERFGHAFAFDTLSSVGEIMGHSKVINSVSIRQQRPFRAVTASDDMTVAFYNGVPFKHNKTIRDHTRFVHAVEFSPNGDYFVSVGADAKIFLYDGKTGDKIDEFSAEGGHTGSIFSLAWSPDSTQILTSSADCTAKLWDVNTKSVVTTFDINTARDASDNQQVGNLWQGDWLLSASLSGQINYLDKSSGKVSRSIDGHAKPVTALAVAKDDTFFTGSYGRVCSWSMADGDETTAQDVGGDDCNNQVIALAVDDTHLYAADMDDMLRCAPLAEKNLSGSSSATGALPVSLATASGVTIVATSESIQVYDEGCKKRSQIDAPGYTVTVASVSADGKTVFVGGQDNKVHIYDLSVEKLTPAGELGPHLGYISALAPHPTLNLIAVGDSVGKIFLYDLETKKATVQNWVFHTGRITSLAWSACGVFLVSGSIDTNIYVWNREKPFKRLAIKNAHVDAVNAVSFLHSSPLRVLSAGHDAAVRIYEITQKPE